MASSSSSYPPAKSSGRDPSGPAEGGGRSSPTQSGGAERPGPTNTGCILRETDRPRLADEYNLPESTLIVLPDATDSAVKAPEGMITVYEHHLRFGLQLPPPPLFQKVMVTANLCLGQLIPVSAALLLGFEGLTTSLGFVDLSPCVFFHFFTLMRSHDAEVSWFMFRGKPGLKIFSGLPSKVRGWKERFFFLTPPEGMHIRRTWYWDTKAQMFLSEATETDRLAVERIRSAVETGPLDLFRFIRPLIPIQWRDTVVTSSKDLHFDLDLGKVSEVMGISIPSSSRGRSVGPSGPSRKRAGQGASRAPAKVRRVIPQPPRSDVVIEVSPDRPQEEVSARTPSVPAEDLPDRPPSPVVQVEARVLPDPSAEIVDMTIEGPSEEAAVPSQTQADIPDAIPLRPASAPGSSGLYRSPFEDIGAFLRDVSEGVRETLTHKFAACSFLSPDQGEGLTLEDRVGVLWSLVPPMDRTRLEGILAQREIESVVANALQAFSTAHVWLFGLLLSAQQMRQDSQELQRFAAEQRKGLELKLAETENKVAAVEGERDALSSSVARAEDMVSRLREEIREDKEEFRRHIEEAQRSRDEARKSRDEAQKSRDEAQKECGTLGAEASRLQSELDASTSELQSSRQRCAELEEEFSRQKVEMAAEVSRLQEEKAAEVARLEGERAAGMAGLQEEMSRIKAEKEALELTCSRYRETKKRLRYRLGNAGEKAVDKYLASSTYQAEIWEHGSRCRKQGWTLAVDYVKARHGIDVEYEEGVVELRDLDSFSPDVAGTPQPYRNYNTDLSEDSESGL